MGKRIKLWVDRVDIEGRPLAPKVVGDDCRPLRKCLPVGRLVLVQAKSKRAAIATYSKFQRAEALGEEGVRALFKTDKDGAADLMVALDSVEVIDA